MAREVMIAVVCDGCAVFDGRRNTEDVETIIVPRSKAELDTCPACRARCEPIFDLIAKRGQVADSDKPGPGRPKGTRSAPRAATQLSLSADDQDWTHIAVPVDLVCPTCIEPIKSAQAFPHHMTKEHPERCKVCVLCRDLTTNPYNHYLRYHPDLPRPAGAWRGESP